MVEAKISDLWDPRKPYLRNLLIMTLTWQALGFTYSLISFELKYLPGDIFSNSYTSAVAEIVAKLGAGVVLMRLGMKPLFGLAFFISFLGAFNMVQLSSGQVDPLYASILIMMTKFGVSMGWVAAIICVIQLFPSNLAATAFGICNVCNKLASMTSPMVAEIAQPTPMIIVAVVTAVMGVLTQKFELN